MIPETLLKIEYESTQMTFRLSVSALLNDAKDIINKSRDQELSALISTGTSITSIILLTIYVVDSLHYIVIMYKSLGSTDI